MDIFLKLFNMSITASWLVLVVILMRLFLKKAPKALHCVLWAMVAIRLICPFSIQSMFSLIPTTQTIPQEVLYVQPSSTSAITNAVEIELLTNPVYPESVRDTVTVSTGGLQIDILYAYLIWLAGMAAMVGYMIFSYLRLRIKVREAVKHRDNILLCDHVPTPFILGVFCPKIYLPSSMNDGDMQYVIAHETAHLKRRDHLWKPLGFLLLTVYWFNPVLWIAYILLCRDIEAACDEKVIRAMGEESKKPYAEALIHCAAPRRTLSACPLAFGETGVKTRVKSVLNYKKPTFWLVLVAVLACLTVAVYFLTDPMGVRLRDKNEHDMPDMIVSTVDGQDYEFASESDIRYVVDLLHDVRVSAEPISENRSEDRDKSNTITFLFENGSKHQYHFNADCSEVWISSEVKPTLTQRVYNSHILLEFFEDQSQEKSTQNSSFSEYAEIYTAFSYQETADPLRPTIRLSEMDNTFAFHYSSISSYLAVGRYELTASTLTLRTDDGKNTYVFDVKQGNYVFNQAKSSPFQEYKYTPDSEPISPVPDGAVFEREYDSIMDSATFDIDGDGVGEKCTLGYGPTSGVFTFWFAVTENGRWEYNDLFHSDFYILTFEQNGGTTYVRAQSQDDPPEVHMFDIKIEGGHIILDDGENELVPQLPAVSHTGGADAPERVYEQFVFSSSEDPLSPTILLSKQDNTFQFTYSGLSSYVPMGTYELTDDQLVLWTSDRYNTYTFDVRKDETREHVFTFDAGESSPIPTYDAAIGNECSPVPDGAIFIYAGDLSENSVRTDRAASFDIDGDGIIEQCVLFDTDLNDYNDAFLKVYSMGKVQMVGDLAVDAYDLNFAQDGEDTYIVAKRSTGDHETVRMEITVDGEFAALYENGVRVGGTTGISCY